MRLKLINKNFGFLILLELSFTCIEAKIGLEVVTDFAKEIVRLLKLYYHLSSSSLFQVASSFKRNHRFVRRLTNFKLTTLLSELVLRYTPNMLDYIPKHLLSDKTKTFRNVFGKFSLHSN